MFRQSRRTKHSVALPAKIFWREPASVPRRPQPDEFADGIQVGGLPEKSVRLLILDRAAETRGDGIDKHQVARVQQRIRIVRESKRRLRQGAVVIHFLPAQTEPTEMQPDRRGTGPAIKTKGDRPRA